MTYTGRIRAASTVADDDMEYTFDLMPRPYQEGDDELPLIPPREDRYCLMQALHVKLCKR